MVEVLDALVPRWEIVVVDDGSQDGTARVLEGEGRRDPRIRAVRHRVNQGYGAALRSGFLAARHELIFFTDADLQFDLREVGSLLALASRADIVAGYRHPRRDPWNRRLNAWAWGRLVNGLFDLGVADVNCAFKLFHRRVLDSIDIRSSGAFVNTEILAQARAAGFSLAQVPVSHYPRRHGEQTGARPAVVLRAFVDLARLYNGVAIAPALSAQAR
jgi:glycosyltransferase involved in cell wall biosynthesis